MSEPIQIRHRIRGNASVLIGRASALARDNGVTISGDARSGRVSGNFLLLLKGSYTIKGKSFCAVIARWPFYISRSDIEEKARNWLRSTDKC